MQCLNYMHKLNQRGAAHLLLIILLLAGLGVAVYLVGQSTNIFPKAYEPKKSALSAPVSPPPAFTCTACAADIVKSARNRVDAQDNAVMSSCYGKSPSTTLPGGRSCVPADINKDGAIDKTDSDCLRSVYFQSCNITVIGNFVKGINLNGTNSYVSIPHSNHMNPYSNFTVEAWIKPEPPLDSATVNNREFSRIISKSSGSQNTYDLSYTSFNTSNGKVHYSYEFGVADQKINCGAATAYSDNGTVNDANGKPINGATVPRDQVATWRHVAGVVNNGNLYIYENGQLIAKNEYNVQQPCSNTNSLQIGARSGGNWQDGFFRGVIDEVRISDIARYPQDWVNAYKPFIKDNATRGLWHLDGNVQDDSHNNLPGGQVVGSAQFVDSLVVTSDGTNKFYK